MDTGKPHYHFWHLGQVTLPGPDGLPWQTLAYTPGLRAYKDRKSAHQRGRLLAALAGGIQTYGKSGTMVLQCDGGASCPLRIDPSVDVGGDQ